MITPGKQSPAPTPAPARVGPTPPLLRLQRSFAAPEDRLLRAGPAHGAAGAPPLFGLNFGSIPVFPPGGSGGAVLRRCSCGGHTEDGGECPACKAAREARENGAARVLAKLEVGPPGDAFEREADAVADAVVSGWDAAGGSAAAASPKAPAARRIQRQTCSLPDVQIPLSAEDADEESRVSSQVPTQSLPPEAEEEPIRMQRAPGAAAARGSHAGPSLPALGGSAGRPLPDGARRDMQVRMGADFASIRIHTDRQAAEMNRALGARAFAYGRDIYFNDGEFNPSSSGGRRLLAHELTHTLQQNGQTVRRLSITGVGALTKGACGMYLRRWDFELGAPAANAGYIVQQVDFYKHIVDCPQMGMCTVNPELTFWEAWPVKKGDTFHEKQSSIGFTDQSSSKGKADKVGYVAAMGEVKFFERSVTGDLGTYKTAPATAGGGWAPNASGQSGILPSTLTKPSWWSNTPTDGPKKRFAVASWRCCGKSNDFNDIKADP